MRTTISRTGEDIQILLPSFELHLSAANRAPKTIKSYTQTVGQFRHFLADHGMPTQMKRLVREHVETFIADQVARFRPKTAQIRFGDLQQFFRWALEEREIEASPMANMKRPQVPEEPPPVLTDDQLTALVRACEGAGLDDLRDMAIVRLFVDSGRRLAELTGLKLEDVDFEQRVAYVLGKGRRPRQCPFGTKTARALDRYVRS